MTTTTLTLTDFLLARIAEDEAVARATTGGEWRTGRDGEDESVFANRGAGPCVVKTIPLGYEVRRANAEHIARHDPARVLAQCEANQRIVDHLRSSAPWTGGGPTALAHFDGFRSGMEFVLRKMAAVYADHPDFNPDWA